MNRTIEGVALASQGSDDKQWHGEVAGEAWVFFFKGHWQGFTKDHLTGTPRLLTLSSAVLWVVRHREEWQAKLRVRRAAGTRLVDPA